MKINAKTFPIFVTVTLMGFSLCLNGCAPSEEKAGEAPSAESSETTENTEGAEETEETKKAKKAEKAKETVSETTPESEKKEDGFVLGNLGIEIRKEHGFTYPETLADVEKMAQEAGGWIAHPVIPSSVLAREYFNAGTPKKTIEDARQMKNVTPEDNVIITDTFQRLPEAYPNNPEKEVSEVNYDGELYRHIGSDVGSFNALFFSTSPDLEAIRYTQTGLLNMRLDTLEDVGNADAIVSWESSADHKMDKIVLRDDMLWSDGEPLTAYDWEFSYNVIMSSAVPIFAIRSGTDLLMGVKAYDERTLVFFHQDPSPIAPASISYYIVPKHIYEKSIYEDPTLTRSPWHQKQEHDPVTSGPYVVEKHLPNTTVVFKRRENYYMYKGKQVREKPYMNRIHFQISPDNATAFMQMKNGDIEVMALLPEQWLTQATTDEFYQKNSKASSASWVYFAFWFNMAKECPFFGDIRTRKALTLAFDYDEMLKVHRKGLDTQCRGIFAEAAPAFPKDVEMPYVKQDYAEARRLLHEAGWEDTDNDGLLDHEWNGKRIPFRFTIQTTTAPESVELCNLFSRCLAHLGIECSVQAMEFNVLCQRQQEHKFQMFLGGWGAGSDPYSTENIWGTEGGRNYISYSNPEVDELFKLGLKEFDRPKRMGYYQKIHQLICEDYPAIWLFNRNTSMGFNKQLRGVGFDYRGSYLMETWKESQAPK